MQWILVGLITRWSADPKILFSELIQPNLLVKMIKCARTNHKFYKGETILSQPYTQTRKTLTTREPYEQDNLSQVAYYA